MPTSMHRSLAAVSLARCCLDARIIILSALLVTPTSTHHSLQSRSLAGASLLSYVLDD